MLIVSAVKVVEVSSGVADLDTNLQQFRVKSSDQWWSIPVVFSWTGNNITAAMDKNEYLWLSPSSDESQNSHRNKSRPNSLCGKKKTHFKTWQEVN